MLKLLVGFFGGIALMRYLTDDVLTDDQRAQVSRKVKDLLNTDKVATWKPSKP